MKTMKIALCFVSLFVFALAGCSGDSGQPGGVENPPLDEGVSPAVDTDGDGVTDDVDACSDTPAGTAVDTTGCEAAAAPPAESIFRDISRYVSRRFDFAFPKWTGIKVFEGAEIDYYANDMAVNQKTGEVYVVGKTCKEGSCTGFWATFSKRGEMSLAAINNREATGVAVDDNGYVYIVGDVDNRTKIVKYSIRSANVKKIEWEASLNKDVDHWAKDVVVDDWEKCVYIVGTTDKNLGSDALEYHGLQDVFLAKFDYENGNLKWIRQLGSGRADYATKAIVKNEIVYITGYTQAAGKEYFLFKVISDGGVANPKWFPDLGSVANSLDLDNLGNIFVTGYYVAAGDYWDTFIQKHDSNLDALSEGLHGIGFRSENYGSGIIVDQDNNILITGRALSRSFIYKFLSIETGTLKAGNFFTESILSKPNCPVGIALDKDGNIYMAGNIEDTKSKIYVAKFNSDLELQ